MNIRTIRAGLDNIAACASIDRSIRFDGTECNVAGFILTREGKLIIPVFQYDESYRDRCENEEYENRFRNDDGKPVTNRDRVRPAAPGAACPFDHTVSVSMAGKTYKISECSTLQAEAPDAEMMTILLTLMNAGWRGFGVSEYSLNFVYMTLLTLEEKLSEIPTLSSSDKLTFHVGKKLLTAPAELPLDLTPDADNAADYDLKDLRSGNKYVLHISTVTKFDPYKEIRDYLNTPGLDRDAQSDIALIMTDHMMKHANDAPQFEITYDCGGATLNFYERAWLDAAPQVRASYFAGGGDATSVGIIGGADGPTAIIMGSPSDGGKKALVKCDGYSDGDTLRLEVTGIMTTRSEFTIEV